ncbi:unnamed protein product [Adineta ricciae]|uniref:HAT C-terminal dimerisation domain-containing protein n=1 Tax=Adineta ricciae TaxID=249248 RepID=A0A815N9A0_ADIRI|nr:unnamed protein product [Adineta ricciae]CAF1433447.1 unnamed protein product [Adineta ricciae]
MSSPEILSPVSVSRVKNGKSRGSHITLLNSSPSSPRNTDKAACAEIQLMLKTKSNEYVIIENTGKHSSNCWNLFGFPAVINDNGDAERISGYVSCRKCFITYSFVSNSTRFLNQHNCEAVKERNQRLAANGTPSAQRRLTTFFAGQSPTLKTPEVMKIKDLQAEWVCQNIRPFSIVEDQGLRRLVQECISIGARHGYIDVDQVLRGADVTAAHVSRLADQHRIRISEELIEPLENDAVTFIPDLWSDPVHQVSYLGVSTTFVNDKFEYRSYDLCCSPFEEEDKSAENILVALQKALGKFNINDLSTLKFVTDRGSNFVKAMKNYSSYFCFAHRLNNILVLGFYQNESIKKQTKISDITGESKTDSDGVLNFYTLDGDIDNVLLVNMSKTKVQDLPDCVREVLKVLNNCKDVVKYVKLNGLNKDIQSEGGFSLCQSSKIRWLSIMQLLGSIDRSFKETKKVLQEKKKSFLIDRSVIKRLIQLLRPFKHILTIVQKGNEPSLYLVLICVMTLRKALSSFENLVVFNRENDNCNDVLKKRQDNGDDEYDIESEEPDGIRFFRLRLLELLESMFILEPIHFAATFLHPRYRYLRKCSTIQIDSCKSYVRRQLKEIVEREKVKRLIHNQESQRSIRPDEKGEPPLKKKKRFGQEYEAGNLSDEYDAAEDDEVEKYLSMFIDPELLVDNPLIFWKANQNNLPLLSKLARMVHSIPATTTAVEREFSGGGLVMNERRSSINPDNLNNILFVRSVTR